MTLLTWNDTSHFGSLRTYTYSNETRLMTILCSEVEYCSISQSNGQLHAVDPDGGPYIAVGGTIHRSTSHFIVDRIVSYQREGETLRITLLIQS